MPIQSGFHIPIYYNSVQQSVFTNIQTELTVAKEHLEKTNSFHYPISGGAGSHQKSDMKKNLFQEYDLKIFEKELNQHIKSYLQGLGIPSNKIKEHKIIHSWMTKTQKNESSQLHNHGRADISGVYYFKTNGNDGSIRFRNPMTQFTTSFLLEHLHPLLNFPPQNGKLLLFPGWLDHDVETNTTDNERISISFNIDFKRPEF
jgi:uncharacterized protein (TIGR02466 family)